MNFRIGNKIKGRQIRFKTILPVLAMLVAGAFAATTPAAGTKDPSKNTAAQPTSKDVKQHDVFVALAKKGNIDLLFLGDSITDGWRRAGGKLWLDNFVPLKAANFGISGDRTQHVLWRVQNGELEGLTPKVVVLMIGTNNLGFNTNDEIAEGITAIVGDIHKRSPASKILLLGIFPRGEAADAPLRAPIKEINSKIAKLNDNKTVFFMDIGDKFLDRDGTLPKTMMHDGVHPMPAGYQIWLDATLPKIKELMNTKP